MKGCATNRKKGYSMAEITELIGKEVEVSANGVSYRGVLVEVSDSEVHLKGTLGYISLPTSSVGGVWLADSRGVSWGPTFAIPPEEKRNLVS
jgi:hypothetical protein